MVSRVSIPDWISWKAFVRCNSVSLWAAAASFDLASLDRASWSCTGVSAYRFYGEASAIFRDIATDLAQQLYSLFFDIGNQ